MFVLELLYIGNLWQSTSKILISAKVEVQLTFFIIDTNCMNNLRATVGLTLSQTDKVTFKSATIILE